jgi:hypothetical protein
MLQTHSRVILVLSLFPVSAILAQTGEGRSTAVLNDAGRVLNTPYAAERHFTASQKRADGTVERTDAGGSEARDSEGRTYSAGERHWTYLDGGKPVLKSEMLYRVHDPVARTDTSWDTTSKEVKVIHWPPGSTPPDLLAALKAFMPKSAEAGEKIGRMNIGGIETEGTRTAYAIAGSEGPSGKLREVVHETWYSPELKIVILETNDDPRSGTTRNELVNIVRGEPDLAKYKPPRDYVIRDVRIPVR